MSATTDNLASINYDPEKQPGISNLLQIFSLLEGRTLQVVLQEYQGQQNYGEFKKVVAESVVKFLKDFQEKLTEANIAKIEEKLVKSEKLMNQIANQTLVRVQKAVGLRQ